MAEVISNLLENNMVTQSKYMTIPTSDLHQASKVSVEILPSPNAVINHFARSIADEIKSNNQRKQPTRLILPVGPVSQYPILAEICNRERISWHNVHTFNMDEYCDWQGRAIPQDHPLSFEGFMFKNLFDKLDPALRIPDDQVHFPDPLNIDAISQKITEVGGIDTCYGGLGYHGHIAFNEPPISRWYKLSSEQYRNSLTRLVHLAPETIVINSSYNTGGNPAELPPMAITLGMRDIYASRRVRLYCPSGTWQQNVLRIALLGKEDVDYPVTLLQGHPDYKIIADDFTAQPPTIGLSVPAD
jgi:glucosamine-6-phosphate deaminase